MNAIRAEELGSLADAAIDAELEYRHQLRLNSTRGIDAADDARHACAARLLGALDNQPMVLKRRGWGLKVYWCPVEGRAACEGLPIRAGDGDLEALVGRAVAGAVREARDAPAILAGYLLPHEAESGPGGPGGGPMG